MTRRGIGGRPSRAATFGAAPVSVVLMLIGWFIVDQVTDWPRDVMIGGVIAIALTCPILLRSRY